MCIVHVLAVDTYNIYTVCVYSTCTCSRHVQHIHYICVCVCICIHSRHGVNISMNDM